MFSGAPVQFISFSYKYRKRQQVDPTNIIDKEIKQSENGRKYLKKHRSPLHLNNYLLDICVF